MNRWIPSLKAAAYAVFGSAFLLTLAGWGSAGLAQINSLPGPGGPASTFPSQPQAGQPQLYSAPQLTPRPPISTPTALPPLQEEAPASGSGLMPPPAGSVGSPLLAEPPTVLPSQTRPPVQPGETPEPVPEQAAPAPQSLPQPGVVQGSLVEQRPVTLLNEEELAKGAEVLSHVLTGSVVKLQQYPIDLPVVLRLIEAQNLPIERDRLTAKLDRTLYWRSLSELLPDIQGTYNQSRFQGVIQIFGNQTMDIYQTRLVPQLTATWRIQPGGEDVFRALAQRQRAKSSEIRVFDSIQDQLTLATNEYYDLLARGIQVANIRLSIQESQNQVALNEARLKAGVGTKLDLELARNQLVQREQLLIQAENEHEIAQQNLLNRLNLDPSVGLIAPQVSAQPRVLVPLTVNTEQLVAKALMSHPLLKMADAEIKALKNEGRAALSRIVPTVTLQTYINGTGPAIHQLGMGRFGGLALQADLLDNLGTAIPLDYRARRLEVRRRQVEREQLIRDIQSAVIRAFLDSRAFAKSVLTAQEELAVAQETYRLAFGRFRAGLGINLDVLTAETSLNNARIRMVQSILQFNQAQARLLRAVGVASSDHLVNGIEPDVFPQISIPQQP